jgi:polysaccharide biosynthesis protein VpsQ
MVEGARRSKERSKELNFWARSTSLSFFMKRIAVLFAVFILIVIILADLNRIPNFIKAIYDFPNGDKVGHFVLFGLLSFFITLAFIYSLPNRDPKLVALSIGLILALLIGLEEFSQKYFSARTFDLVDLAMSYFGVLVGGWIAYKLKK